MGRQGLGFFCHGRGWREIQWLCAVQSILGFAMIWPQGRFGTGMAGRRAMKIFVMAVAMLALIAMPAHAQMSKHKGVEPSGEQPSKKVDEKAYNSALERIPEPKVKYDPWGVARPADGAKKPK
jgi:hypothetical protein